LKTDEILRTLKRIWSRPGEGYVFMPYIPKEMAVTKEKRDKGWTEVKAFDLKDWGRIREHIEAHLDDELYFTPMVFSRPQRRKEYAKATSRLWADLDEADPREIDPVLYPQIAWETSPGRYDAIWCMSGVRPETTERGGENHRLTIAVGADPSGWDTTQLLRVPGSANNKPGYPKNYHGRLLWAERGSHTWDTIDALPELPISDTVGGDLLDETALDGVDPFEAYARLRKHLPGIVRQYMRLKEADDTMDRSSIAWQIERELADAGATLIEMVAIMRPTPWNKHYGRRDELKRLQLECAKALAAKKEPEHSTLDKDEEVKASDLVPFWNNEAYLNAPEPEWLYEEFIPHGGCGFISGIPKSMKTWLAMDLCISAALGVNYLGYQVEKPINVLYVQREDPTTLVRNRHHVIASSKHPKWALSDNPREVRPYPGALYVETTQAIDVSDEGWQVWLAEQIRKADLDLVVFDTLTRVAPGIDLDSATAATAEVLNPIKEVARDNDCAIVFVHHNTKSQSNERAAQNMAGSGQIHAWADFGIYITQKTEDNIIAFTHETKYTGTNQLKFKLEGLEEDPQRYDPVEWVGHLTAPPAQRNGRSSKAKTGNPNEDDLEGAQAPAKVRVRAFIRQHPEATVRVIAEGCGVSERTVRGVKNGSK
jgi:hypothetical protein